MVVWEKDYEINFYYEICKVIKAEKESSLEEIITILFQVNSKCFGHRYKTSSAKRIFNILNVSFLTIFLFVA